MFAVNDFWGSDYLQIGVVSVTSILIHFERLQNKIPEINNLRERYVKT